MKKRNGLRIWFSAVMVCMLLAVTGCSPSFNRMNAEVYYTKITGEGEVYEDKSDSGDSYTRYRYNLPAYSKDGTKKDLEFTSSKQLKVDAYLKVYYKEEKGVTSYEEVTFEKLPDKVSEALK